MTEQERVHQVMRDVHAGNESSSKLIFVPETKTISASSSHHDPDKVLAVTPSDMEHFVTGGLK